MNQLLGLLQTDAGREATQHLKPVASVLGPKRIRNKHGGPPRDRGLGDERDPHISRLVEVMSFEGRRSDADDLTRLILQGKDLAEDLRIGTAAGAEALAFSPRPVVTVGDDGCSLGRDIACFRTDHSPATRP